MKLIFLFIIFQICLFIFFNKSTVAFAKDLDVIKSIKITNENGQNKETYIPGDRIRVDVQWKITEQAKKGDTFTFTLPKELRKFDGSIDLKDKEGISYGKGISNGNNIIFTFSDEVERRENIGGYFYIQSQIEHMKYEENKRVKIQFVVNGRIHDTSASIDAGSQTAYSKSNSSPKEINEVFYKFGNVSRENEDILEWALRINYKGDTLANCRIYDNLRDGHELIPGSIQIYKGYTNFNDGSISNLTKVPLDTIEHYECKKGFDLYLYINREVYTIYYKTKVLRKSEDYSNEAVLQAWSKEPIYRECIVKTFSAGGEAWGELKKFKGKLKIIKQDEKTNLRLSGAEFQLLDDKQNKIIANLKTDENGEAITDDISSGIYYLKEIKAPDEYELEANSNSIQLNFKQNNIIERVITNKKIESKESQEPKVEPEKPEVKEPEVKEEPKVKQEKPEVKNPELKEEPKVEPEKLEIKEPEIKEEPTAEPEKPEVKEPELKEEPKVELEKPEVKEPEVKEPEIKEEPKVKLEKSEVKEPEVKEHPVVETEKPEIKDPEIKEEPVVKPEKLEIKKLEIKEEPKVELEKPEVKELEVKEDPVVKPEKLEIKKPEIKEEPKVELEKPEVKEPEIKEEPKVKLEKSEVKEPEVKEHPVVETEKPEIKDPEIKEEPVVKPEKLEIKKLEIKEEPKVELEKPEVKELEVKEDPVVKPEKLEIKKPEIKEEPKVELEKPEVKEPEIKEEPKVESEKPEVKEPEIKEKSKVKPEKLEIKETEIKEEPEVEPEIIIDPDDEVPLGNPEYDIDNNEEPENPEKPQEPEIIEDPEDAVSLGNIEPNKNPEKPKKNVKPTNKKENKKLKPVTDNNSNKIKILPKTGESNKALFYIGGLIIIILGIFIKKRI
ncbi:putative S-layer protein (peptidoglycan anchored) [Clostridium novyi NT]|uniref:Putative S-layer protein (Peptidoglycan anchored) n=4 Tax=Clostridium novyi TaxID=1542 RepID=A0Q263_CLONN|nr:putative S-layer protein (peptidoglycan anchored) [Clostridium novyi NT]